MDEMTQAIEDAALMALVGKLAELKHNPAAMDEFLIKMGYEINPDAPQLNYYDDLMAEHGPEIEAAEARHAKRMGW